MSRRARFASTLVLAALLTWPARAFDHAALDALSAHTGDGWAAAGAPCRLPGVDARLTWLADDLALARTALDSAMTQLRRVTSEEDSLEIKYASIHFPYNGNGQYDVPRLHELAQESADIGKAMDAIENRRQADLNEIELLSRKPPCVPMNGTPSHRTTNCEQCRKAAEALNAASDKLQADQADPKFKPLQLAADRDDVLAKQLALDQCEKACHEHSGFFDNFHVGVGVGVGVGGGGHSDSKTGDRP